MDPSTGTSYESGYYDEDGQRYDNVSFAKNGTYENVVCKCEYCGQDTVVDLSADDAVVKSVNCPNCGAPMAIRSALDEDDGSSSYTAPESTQSYDRVEETQAAGTKKKSHIGTTVIAVILALLGIGRLFGRMTEKTHSVQTVSSYTQQATVSSDTIRLSLTGDHAYSITSSAQKADKTLVWDADEDSYYDADSDCWLWYNEDVTPAIWQYWYEGISSDYGDYGWMEHDDDGWWIEASYGNWIPLPSLYDASDLWHIDE